MSEEKKPKLIKPKFSPWLIYAIVIGGLITISLFNNDLSKGTRENISISKFYGMLDNGDIAKVTKSGAKAIIYLKKEAVSKAEHKKVALDVFSKKNELGPHYITEVGLKNDV